MWFEKWCNDEFRHGEAFALLMRSNPKLLTGINRYWIKFFLLAVYSTMYVRDHSRVEFHQALGVSPTEYDREVLKLTSEISKQVFPFTIDLDNDAVWSKFAKLKELSDKMEDLKENPGVLSSIKRLGYGLSAAATFVSLYFIPVVSNELPHDIRLKPVW